MQTNHKKVLIITYYWPPSGGVGVQRWMHFAINLKQLGWEPIIYTPSNPQFDIKDDALLDLVSDIRVIEQPIWEPFSIFHRLTGKKNKDKVQQGLVLEKSSKGWLDHLFVWIRGNLFVPDPRVFWVRPSVKFLRKLIAEEDITHCITTSPPHSMHLIGLKLKKVFPALKWMPDLRDAWSGWDILPKLYVSALVLSIHRRLERKVLEGCDRVLTVGKGYAAEFQSKAKQPVTIEVIRNGMPARHTETNTSPDPDHFTIGYFGLLNELRDPDFLWDMLSKFCSEDESFAKKLRLRIGGIVSETVKTRLLEDEYLGERTTFLGYLKHEEVFQEYLKCDLLLLLQNKSDNAQWVLPVKFFEYLSAKQPILCIAPDKGELAEIIQGHKIGEVHSSESPKEIGQFIQSVYAGEYEIDEAHFEQLLKENSRDQQAKDLAAILERF